VDKSRPRSYSYQFRSVRNCIKWLLMVEIAPNFRSKYLFEKDIRSRILVTRSDSQVIRLDW